MAPGGGEKEREVYLDEGWDDLLKLFFYVIFFCFIFGCSSLVVVRSLGFTGVMLLYVVLHAFLPIY